MKFPDASRIIPVVLALFLALTGGCSRKAKATRHLEAANGYFTAGQYDKAEIEYLNVLKLDRTNLTAIRNLGSMCYTDEEMIRSISFFNAVKQLDPTDLESRGKLSRLFFGGGLVKEAREEASFVLKSSPTNENALLVLIDANSKPDEIKAVRKLVGELRQKAGEKALFHVANGYLSLKEGDDRGAEAGFKAALALDANSSLAHWALGNFYLSKTNYALAEPALKSAVDMSPLRSSRRLKLVALKLQTGDVPTGKAMLEELLTKAPDFLPAWFFSARMAMADKNLEKCAADLGRVLNRVPDSFEALSLRAESYLAGRNAEKALADLEKLVTRYPANAAARYQHALGCLMNRDMVKAMASLTQAITLDPNFTPAVLMLAELNTNKGDAPPAIAALTDHLKKHPKDEKALLILASAYQVAGRFNDAVSTYLAMMQNFPKNPQLPLLLGLTYRQQGNEAEARKMFEKVVAERPEDATAISQLVDLDIAAKNPAPSLPRIQRWMEKTPKDPEPFFQMAKLKAAQKDLKGAEALLEKVIDMNGNAIPAYLMLARLAYSSGNVDAALQKCEAAYARNTNNTSTLLMAGMIHAEKKDYPKARDAYEKLLAATPDSLVVLNNLAALYADYLGQMDKAYALARKADELNPNDPDVADTFGWILARRGEFGLAVGRLKLSLQKRPDSPEVLAHLGMTYYLMGDEAAAHASLERALQSKNTFSDRAEAEQFLAVLNTNPATVDAKIAADLEKRLESRPADPIVLTRLAAAWQRAGQADRIITAYERALAASPKMVTVMARLADLYATNPVNQAKALDLAKNARKLAPEDPQIAHIAGRVALRSPEVKEQQWALSLLQESNQKQANNPQAQHDLALAYYSQGRLGDAESSMKNAATLSPNSPVAQAAQRFLSFLPLQSDPARSAQALPKAEEALAAEPNYAPALMVRALASERGNPSAALKTYDQVLAIYPGFSPAIRNSSILLATQPGDKSQAIVRLTKAREVFPNDAEIAKALGTSLYQKGDFAKAIRPLSESAKKFPEDAPLQYVLGMTHFQLKQPQESKTALKKALTLQANAAFAADAQRVLAELK